MSETAPLPSPFRRWLITATMMAAMLMQLLDTTIANVALPHMQAALGATPESIVWVLTSYIVMAAITTPISGWLEGRVGRKRLLTIAIAGFTASSALCGVATSLEMMVASRAMQGIFGAFLVPLGQATMLDSSPREKHPQALLIVTMGLTLSPIMGPVLGGWLTDTFGWRWVFYINVPTGIIASVAAWVLVADIPRKDRRFDLIGFALLAIVLASFQLLLDRGGQRDWFESTEIIVETGLAIGCGWMFVIHSMSAQSPLLPMALFRDRNFIVATCFHTLIAGIIYSGSAQLAPMLQTLMGYDPVTAGLMMMPRGVGVFLAMPIVTALNKRVDPRLPVAGGLMLVISSLWVMTGLDLETDSQPLIIAGLLQGVGVGFCVMPLTIMAYATLSPAVRTEGVAINNLSRNLGGSVSIAVVGMLLARNVQTSHSDLSMHVTTMLLPLTDLDLLQRLGLGASHLLSFVDLEINRQAFMIAYLDNFWVMMWTALIALPMVVLLRRKKDTAEAPPPILTE